MSDEILRTVNDVLKSVLTDGDTLHAYAWPTPTPVLPALIGFALEEGFMDTREDARGDASFCVPEQLRWSGMILSPIKRSENGYHELLTWAEQIAEAFTSAELRAKQADLLRIDGPHRREVINGTQFMAVSFEYVTPR